MFGNLRFITIFDNFLFPSQVDLSAHCFYHFWTSNVLILDATTHWFHMEISVLKFKLGNLMENPLFKIRSILFSLVYWYRYQHTKDVCPFIAYCVTELSAWSLVNDQNTIYKTSFLTSTNTVPYTYIDYSVDHSFPCLHLWDYQSLHYIVLL